MREIKAPKFFDYDYGENVLFLAGSIEMGTAEPWQDEVVKKLSHAKDLIILNPRRTDWDSSWVQSVENEQFNEQVSWELAGLEKSHGVLFYFDPNTKSPITLMELGLTIGLGHTAYVICPEGFWRKGNVDIICKRNGVPQYKSIDEWIAAYYPNPQNNKRSTWVGDDLIFPVAETD